MRRVDERGRQPLQKGLHCVDWRNVALTSTDQDRRKMLLAQSTQVPRELSRDQPDFPQPKSGRFPHSDGNQVALDSRLALVRQKSRNPELSANQASLNEIAQEPRWRRFGILPVQPLNFLRELLGWLTSAIDTSRSRTSLTEPHALRHRSRRQSNQSRRVLALSAARGTRQDSRAQAGQRP